MSKYLTFNNYMLKVEWLVRASDERLYSLNCKGLKADAVRGKYINYLIHKKKNIYRKGYNCIWNHRPEQIFMGSCWWPIHDIFLGVFLITWAMGSLIPRPNDLESGFTTTNCHLVWLRDAWSWVASENIPTLPIPESLLLIANAFN